jgi:hypothetical protein
MQTDRSERMQAQAHIKSVDWEAAARAPRVSPSALPETLAQFFRESPVPVLLPDNRKALASAEPTIGQHWYAVMLTVDGREVTIEGDRVARDVESAELTPTTQDSNSPSYRLSQTHGVLTLSFTRFGVAYTVDVECEVVTRRGTCRQPEVARRIADALRRVGGGS